VYIEKRYLQKIARVFEGLSLPVKLVDANGQCLVPEGAAGILLPAATLAQGISHRVGDYYLRVLDMNPALYLVAPADAPGAADVLFVADAMLMSLLKSGLSIASHTDVYRRVLKQELTGSDLAARASEHQIPMESDRCVMLFQMEQTDRNSAYAILGELMGRGVKILTNTSVEGAENDTLICTDAEGKKVELPYDYLLVAMGTKSENSLNEVMDDNFPEVYTIGDCVKTGRIHHAIHQAYDVAKRI